MTTTITPGAGDGVLITQQGIGTSPGYSALDIRRLFSGSLQEGVYGTSTLVTAGGVSNVAAADFMVTQRASGANLSVDINMPGGGMAFVQGDSIAGQGLYGVPVAASNINEAIAAADLTNPRLDQVILEVQDNVLDASGGNLARTRVLTGTPGSTVTLNSRAGAATLPGSALLLADVLVPANATTVPNSNIRDRRKWARGAFASGAGSQSGADYTTTATSFTNVDSTRLSFRIECSGAPLQLSFHGTGYNTVNSANAVFSVGIDGTTVGGASDGITSAIATANVPFAIDWVTIPIAGSHIVAAFFAAVSSTAGIVNKMTTIAGGAPVLRVREVIALNAQNNNGVTTG